MLRNFWGIIEEGHTSWLLRCLADVKDPFLDDFRMSRTAFTHHWDMHVQNSPDRKLPEVIQDAVASARLIAADGSK